MSEYGVTQNGFIRKRYDVILSELQARLSDSDTGFGFDIASNPQSFLNVALASFAGKINELWQLSEQIYFSQYVSTADGVSLDNAASYGGVKRQLQTQSKFYIACTGVDGTTLQSGTKLSTANNPKVVVENQENYYISRSNCTSITISVGTVANSSTYTITIENVPFSITSRASATKENILQDLDAKLVEDSSYNNSFFHYIVGSGDNAQLVLAAKEKAHTSIEVNTVADSATYTVTINGTAYSYTSGSSATKSSIIAGINTALASDTDSYHCIFGAGADELILIPTGNPINVAVTANLSSTETEKSADIMNRSVALTENLSADVVTSCFLFYAVEYGPIYVPAGGINKKVSTPVNLQSVVNIGEPTLGRNTETDVEFRQSYIKKIASRSSTMLDSIVSGILTGVQDVASCTAYENVTDTASTIGTLPNTLPIAAHSVLVIVDCPNSRNAEVAAMILKKKAAGIQTNGDVEVLVPTTYSGSIPIRFYKPEYVTIYIQVVYTRNSDPLPSNADQIIRDTIIEQCASLKAGDTIIPQDWVSALKKACSGISYFDIQVKDNASSYAPLYTLGVNKIPEIEAANISISQA